MGLDSAVWIGLAVLVAVFLIGFIMRRVQAGARAKEARMGLTAPAGAAGAWPQSAMAPNPYQAAPVAPFDIIRPRWAVITIIVMCVLLGGIFIVAGVATPVDVASSYRVAGLFIVTMPDILASVGVIVVALGLFAGIKMWRWRLHVSDSGLELNPGLGAARNLSYAQVGSVSFTNTGRYNITLLTIKGSDGRKFAQVQTAWVGYGALVQRLAAMRPDLMGGYGAPTASPAPWA